MCVQLQLLLLAGCHDLTCCICRLQAFPGCIQAGTKRAAAGSATDELPAAHQTGALLQVLRAACADCQLTAPVCQALAQHSLPLLQLAKREYSAALGQDPALQQLVDEVEGSHFGTRGPAGGGLGELLSSMLGA